MTDVYNRTNYPENFFDMTSDMLLGTPEPQYLYAQMWLGAMQVSLPTPTELGLPGRAIGGVGTPYASEDRDRLMLANPMFNSVIAAGIDFNAMPGQTVRINRPKYTNTTYTLASRRVASGDTISVVPVKVGSQQTNLTLERYAGPYDTTNSRVAPYALERFDSKFGVHNAVSIHGTQLSRDFHYFIDAVQVTLLDLASTAVYPEGMSAVDDATTLGEFPFTFEQITRMEQTADDASLPTFPDGFRALVITPTQLRQLRNDPEYQAVSQNFAQYSVLFPGYVGSVGRSHIFQDTTLTVTNNANSIPIHYGHYIAPGALLAGMGEPPRITASTDDNYGEQAKVIWLLYAAFGLANNEYVISVRSSA